MKFAVVRKSSLVHAFIALVTIVMLTFLCVGTGAYTAVSSRVEREIPIYSVGREDNKIAITFDCAWGVDYTDKLLNTLKEKGVKATFFAVEFWVEKYPEYVKRISDEGHVIGTHSKTHSHMSKLSESEIIEELESSKEAIESVISKKVTVFRPPFGDYDDLLIKTAKMMDLYTIQWDVDSLDWKDYSADKICKRVVNGVKSGSIILCHNNGLHTAEALPRIIDELIGKGYEFVTVPELIFKDDFTVDANGRQVKNN